MRGASLKEFNSQKVVTPVLYLTGAEASANRPWHESAQHLPGQISVSDGCSPCAAVC